MTLRIFLTVLEIVGLVGVLAYFLAHIASLLKRINGNLGRIAFGVRAVETQCNVIAPAVERINANLRHVNAGLTEAAKEAEPLVR
ncbi:MAG: hypothetical protein LC792_16400 [Actinobacteria bacterium]|nr:hypothetical protein [Actinomycetota bacterium]